MCVCVVCVCVLTCMYVCMCVQAYERIIFLILTAVNACDHIHVWSLSLNCFCKVPVATCFKNAPDQSVSQLKVHNRSTVGPMTKGHPDDKGTSLLRMCLGQQVEGIKLNSLR